METNKRRSLALIWDKCSMLSENISKQQLAEVEKFADKLFAKIGVDVELSGKHFFDRLNDTRNDKDISTAELVALFRKTFKMHKKPISNMDAGFQAVIKDINASINLPFMIKWDAKGKEFDLIAKTIMRKKNFTTPDDVLKV